MCGICAYIGGGQGMFDLIHRGLVILQNRGYDAAGLAFNRNGCLEVYKRASTEEQAAIEYISKVCSDLQGHEQETSGCVISHLRWRTCGRNDDESAHPAISFNKKFALVHNGIIENYMEIREDLITKGVEFVSHTDTEVIVNLMGYIYQTSRDVVTAIRETLSKIEGTWGLVIMCVDEPNKLYCARHGSPLLIGFGDDFAMVASEQTGFSGSVQNFICLRDNDIVTLEKNTKNKVVMRKVSSSTNAEHELRKVSAVDVEVSPTPFPHWTLKEIYEQREAVLRAIGGGGRISSSSTVKLGGLAEHQSKLVDVDNLVILGCGSSYNAGMYAVETFRKISGFNTVSLYDGADFSEMHLPRDGKTALLLLSQSGETKDLHRALEIGKTLGLYMIGVVNVVDSLIAREVDCGVYLNAGREVGVAATKSFTSQVVVLHLIAVWFAQIRGLAEAQREDIIEGLRALSVDVETTIYDSLDAARSFSKYLAGKSGMFVLGRGYSEAIARESALKIKEVSYVLAESYNSSALKHGPYSVLEAGFPVLLIAPTDMHLQRNIGVVDELASRDAYVVCIGDSSMAKTRANIVIKTPMNRYFSSLLCIISSQLIAYYTSVEKGTRVDTPRHLCKTVSTD